MAMQLPKIVNYKASNENVQRRSNFKFSWMDIIKITVSLTLIFIGTYILYFVCQKNSWTYGPESQSFVQEFLIVILLVLCGIVLFFIIKKPAKQQSHINRRKKNTFSICTQAGIIHVMPRNEWGAEPPKGTIELLQTPLDNVIISHTADIGRFTTTSECVEAVKNVQQIGFSFGFSDIAYNYLIGNDGVVYEGRGVSCVSATAKGWNHCSIGIAFIGKFVNKMPSDEAIDACNAFMQYLVDQGVLKNNFTIYGLCQVREKFSCAPGPMLYREIQTWHGTGKHNTWRWREKVPLKN